MKVKRDRRLNCVTATMDRNRSKKGSKKPTRLDKKSERIR